MKFVLFLNRLNGFSLLTFYFLFLCTVEGGGFRGMYIPFEMFLRVELY